MALFGMNLVYLYRSSAGVEDDNFAPCLENQVQVSPGVDDAVITNEQNFHSTS